MMLLPGHGFKFYVSKCFFLLFGCFTAFCYLDVLLPLKTGSFSISHTEVWLLCTNAGTSDYSVDHLLINLSRPSGTAETPSSRKISIFLKINFL